MSLFRLLRKTRMLLEYVQHLTQVSAVDRSLTPPVQALRLEERILMSAAPVAVVTTDAQQTDSSALHAEVADTTNDGTLSTFSSEPTDLEASLPRQLETLLTQLDGSDVAAADGTSPTDSFQSESAVDFGLLEVVFVDPSVEGFREIVDECLRRHSPEYAVDVVTLDPSRNGLAQITTALSQRPDVNAIHIVSQGSDHDFKVGDTWVSVDTFAPYRSVFEGWANSLVPGAELHLYGCTLEDSPEGSALISEIATASGANVLVSPDTSSLWGTESSGWLENTPAESSDQGSVIKATESLTDSSLPAFVEQNSTLPLAFEQNRGQADDRVDFLARGSGYSVFLTEGDAVLRLKDGDVGSVIRLDVVGADPTDVIGTEELNSKTNYLLNDLSLTNLSNYHAVVYRNVYEGIDLKYYGNERMLEYDFVVGAGADASLINLNFSGAASVQIAENGDLVLTLPASDTDTGEATREVRFNAPVSYQQAGRNGIAAYEAVSSRYVIQDDGTIGFELGDYDHSRELIIDPVLNWAAFLKGSVADDIRKIATDSSGNVYVTGSSNSTDYATSSGAFDTTHNAFTDIVVTKLSSSGSLVYSTYIGGSADEAGSGIAVDSSGNAYVAGWTESSNFPTLNAFDSSLGGTRDAVLLKLNSTGTALSFSTFFGGSSTEQANALALDSSGNAYITGLTASGQSGSPASRFSITSGVLQTALGGSTDAFVSKFSSTGTLTYSTYLGASGTDSGVAIAVDSSGNAYVGGTTQSADFSTTGGFDTSLGGTDDGFITKINSTATAISYSTFVGSDGTDTFTDIALDSSNNVYFVGSTSNSGLPITLGAYDSSLDSTEGFVGKLNPSLTGASSLSYLTYLGGSGYDVLDGIAVDGSGNAYVVGTTYSSTFPTTADASDATLGGFLDATFTIFNSTGTAVMYSTLIGGSLADSAHAIVRTSTGRIAIAGTSDGTSIDNAPTTYSYGGAAAPNDGFVVMFDPTSITGTVYEDVDGDGSIVDDGTGLSGVTVKAYLDDGDGVIDAGDTLAATTTTNTSGVYQFGILANGTYWVVVDSKTITSNIGLNGGFTAADTWAEQTYAATGAVSYNGSYSYSGAAGTFFGGMQQSVSDNASALTSAEHVHKVVFSGTVQTDVDSGFSFNVLTTSRDVDDSTGNRTTQGGLRQFIQNSNALGGVQSVNFEISTSDPNYNLSSNGKYTILPTFELPAITEAVFLDATTQNGFGSEPIVVLDGTNAGAGSDGLILSGNGTTVRGFVINSFNEDGIQVSGNNNTVIGNWIGTTTNGLTADGNVQKGVRVEGANNTIGGTTAALRNVISGNTEEGIYITSEAADGNTVLGNYIGLTGNGNAALANGAEGIEIRNGADNNIIGGTSAGARNIVSGNASNGVLINGTSTTGNQLLGNYIGTDNTGLVALGNGDDGVEISGGASGNTVGGTTAGAGNVIAGNTDDGVQLNDVGTSNNIVQGNFIGVGSDGVTDLGNQIGVLIYGGATNNTIGGTTTAARNVIAGNSGDGVQITDSGTTGNIIAGNYVGLAADGSTVVANNYGIYIQSSASNNIIGGTTNGAGNTITGNTLRGVVLSGTAGAGNSIYGNSIYNNGDTDIDLGANGVTANDALDADIGANNLQNKPTLTSAITNGGTATRVQGTLSSAASTTYRIEFFASTSVDGSGFGPGQRYLGFVNVTTNGSGSATIDSIVGGSVLNNEVVTATATDNSTGDTSEFSAAVTAQAFQVTNSNDTANGDTSSIAALLASNGGDGISLREAITAANNSSGTTVVGFNISGGGVKTITLGSALPDIMNPIYLDATMMSGYSGAPLIELNGGSTIGANGLRLRGGSSTVRGLAIYDFDNAGIRIDTANSSTIEGNYLGLKADGTASGNGDGLLISSNSNIIGGTSAAQRNVIGGNTGEGIRLNAASNNVIKGNYLGVAPNGTTLRANGDDGIDIGGGSASNVIGGTAAGEGNIIANSSGNGIELRADSGSGNTISGNNIYSSGGLGIDIAANGVTANDAGDSDVGVNALQNFPVLSGAITDLTQLSILGSFNSTPSTNFRIEFFSNSTGDGTGYGEGQTYLGSANVTTDGSGNATINSTLNVVVNSGDKVTATATNLSTNNTSEFSANVTAMITAITVDTTSDTADGTTTSINALLADRGADGRISLREAITAANNTANVGGVADKIQFNISGSGPHTINVASALPDITEAVFIDGWSEPDFGTTPIIELNGTSAGASTNGLYLISGSSGSTIRGLTINRFSLNGIAIGTSNNNTIVGNYIGTDTTGSSDLGNTLHGIAIFNGSSNNIIGGTTAADRNVISGNNSNGIDIATSTTTGNIVQGNYIGTNAAGTAALGNTLVGVAIAQSADANIIGTAGGGRNVISGNGQYGVRIVDTGTDSNLVQNNYIGLNAAGTTAIQTGNSAIRLEASGTATGNVIGGTTAGLGNVLAGNFVYAVAVYDGMSATQIVGNIIGLNAAGTASSSSTSSGGIYLSNSANNVIGGTTAAARNVISSNGGIGIFLSGAGSTGNTVQGNYIGTDINGLGNFGNGAAGISFDGGAASNTIGGTATGAGNIVANSGSYGVQVSAGAGINNAILSNRIYSNAQLGIDLGTFGVTANDAGDSDAGANALQNFPVLTSANVTTAGTTIVGTLNSNASTTYRIEFYSSRPTLADATNGEGHTYLGSTSVTTDGAGNASINTLLARWINSGDKVTATATVDLGGGNYGSTSEFAVNVNATSAANILVVDTTSDVSDGTTTSITNLRSNRGADGVISLREAITATNGTAGTDYILFNIADPLTNGAHSIAPATALPAITGATIIDGTTDDSFSSTPIIELNGTNAGISSNGLSIQATSTVRGLVVNRFGQAGIAVTAGTGTQIVGNYIGTDVTGTIDLGNTNFGINVSASSNTIGGTTAADRNVISGNNGDGIRLSGNSNTVQGNYVGTNAAGNAALGNSSGIVVSIGSSNVIGTAGGGRNVISGNVNGGVFVGSANGTTVRNNFIGTDAAGTSSVANDYGITVDSGVNVTIGSAGLGNVVSGNTTNGITFQFYSTGNKIQGNYVGTDLSGTLNLGNDYRGIWLYNGGSNTVLVGGDISEGNIVKYNAWNGVEVYVSGNASIIGNSISNNGLLGIDNNADGVTTNDPGDGDTGPNGKQNFPVLTTADSSGGTTTIYASLNSTPSTTYRIDYYSSPTGDSNGYGEGATHLGYGVVTTDGSGTVNFNTTIPGLTLTAGHKVTATATVDLGGGIYGATSEFAANITATVSSNAAPILTNGSNIGYSEGSGAAAFTLSTLTDGDSADMDTGTLTFSVASGADGTDVLGFANFAGVTTSGSNVLVSGVTVGTFSGGSSTIPLVVTFNTNATPARVQSVLQALRITTGSNNPTGGARVLNVVVTDSDGGTSNTASATVTLTPVNDGPSLSSLNATPTFTEGGRAVVFDNDVAISDPELSDINNFNGATITLARNGGAISNDIFSATGNLSLLTQGGNLVLSGVTIGTVTTNSSGTLLLTFNASATEARVNETLRSIAYENNSSSPPASVQIDWTFSDGNTGAQGAGGPLQATGSITVNITAAAGNVVTVTTTSDVSDGTTTSIAALIADKGADGKISLREAITAANNTANNGGLDQIHFDLSTSDSGYQSGTGHWLFTINSSLPSITEAVRIDGSTQTGFVANTNVTGGLNGTQVIELSAANTSYSILSFGAAADFTEIHGLVVNSNLGVSFSTLTTNVIITGSYFGTDITGTTAKAGGNNVMSVFGDSNRIGGTTAAERNLISGHGFALYIAGNDNLLQGNLIGTNAAGTAPLGTQTQNVVVRGSNNTVGGTAANAGNVITGPGVGVSVDGGTGNALLGNSIYDNTGTGTKLGIDLSPANTADGVTANDAGDADTGTNNYQNFPVLTAAMTTGTSYGIAGSLNSTASTTFRIEFFSSPVGDGSGYGEGQTYLGFTNVTTDSTGNVSFAETFTGTLTTGHIVTATATNLTTNDTSEFALNVTAQAGLIVDTTSDVSDGTTTSIANLVAAKGADGKISLREAIIAANNTANGSGGADRIYFNIPDALVGGTHTIYVGAGGLPSITTEMVLDATTDADFSSSPIIVLDGSSAGPNDGLQFLAGSAGSSVRGFVIQNFGANGIWITGTSNVTVAGNYIGTNASGTAAAGNSNGIMIENADNNIIGGTSAADRNVISGSLTYTGVWITNGSDNNLVLGNYIGTNAAGTADLGNALDGIVIAGSINNTIGGTAAGARNIISGNNGNGVLLDGALGPTSGNILFGNYIGLNAAGTAAIGNALAGIALSNGANANSIGGSAAGSMNVIAGNSNAGIGIDHSDSNIVMGNRIGTNAAGTSAIANIAGVSIFAGANNVIGGLGADQGNLLSGNSNSGVTISEAGSVGNEVLGNRIGTEVTGTSSLSNGGAGIRLMNGASSSLLKSNTVAFNGYNGVRLDADAGNGNSILENSIYSNTFFEIELNDDGASANDLLDVDTGANSTQNFPVLTSALTTGTSFSIAGTLNSTASTTFRIEFFSSPTGEASGYGPGQTYLGFTTVITDISGIASFSANFTGTLTAGHVVTATATVDLGGGNYGSTSEFSANVVAISEPQLVVSGAFSGNGIDNRAITGLGFTPALVIIIDQSGTQIGVIRTSNMVGDVSKPLSGSAGLSSNLIQSFDSDGFTLGNDVRVNAAASTYHWTAFAANSNLYLGSYTGNGTSQTISGIAFQPELVFTIGAGASPMRFNSSLATTNAFAFNSGAPGTAGIQTYTADGYTLGSGASVNGAGQSYYFVAFNESSGYFDQGTYTGNSTDNQNITGVGFTPEFLLVRETANNNLPTFRTGSVGDMTDIAFVADASGSKTDAIQQLDSDGFQVGTSSYTNANGATFAYFAFAGTTLGSNTAPVITSNGGGATASINIAENTTAVTTVTATDTDIPAQSLTYSITGGADAAMFAIDPTTGVLTFVTTPDFETPGDSGSNNVYDLTVTVSDGNGGNDSQVITVTVIDISNLLVVSNTLDSSNGDTSSVEALNANDGGDGISLREAILAANNTAGTQTIEFEIAGALISGAHTIALGTDLPAITDAVIIDGTTDGDFVSTPIIRIDDAGTGIYGLHLNTNNSTIRGLSFTRADEAGLFVDGSDNSIIGNWFGVAPDQTTQSTAQKHGLVIGGSGNIIGGTTAADRNVMVDNWYAGITINGSGADNNQIRGNYIGVMSNGTTFQSNSTFAIYMANGADNNVIGTNGDGTNDALEGNIIAGAYLDLGGGGMTGLTIAGNRIGTDVNGNALHPTSILLNAGNGVRIGTDSNGTSDSLEGNIIAGGIDIVGDITNFTIAGNHIGVGLDGTTDLGNTSDGIRISTNSTGMIGGTSANAANVIAFNDDNAIEITGTGTISILGNSIHSNGGLGIDLGNDGVTSNDVGDADTGPNGCLNFPTLSTALSAGGDTTISGTYHSTASSTFRIDFFSSLTGDASGYGEGQTYLGFTTVTTDGAGNATISTTLTGVSIPAGHYVSATATVDLGGGNYGATSEFGAHIPAVVNSSPVAAGNEVTGTEDTDFVFSWTDFQITDADSPITDNTAVQIRTLPVDGQLQIFTGFTWNPVTINQTITKSDIDAGRLRFVPDANEFGHNGLSTPGVGSGLQSYAEFNYRPVHTIAITNPGAEADYYPTEGTGSGTTTGWTQVNSPYTSNFSSTAFPGDHDQVFSLNQGDELHQTLSTAFSAANDYELSVDVGWHASWLSPEFRAELWAGSTRLGFVDQTSITPLVSSFVRATLTVSGSTFAALDGQSLQIRLIEAASGANAVMFDNVMLTTVPAGIGSDATMTIDLTSVNDAPVVSIGGAYSIAEGGTLNLNASATTDIDSGSLTYRWDLDNDGAYDDLITTSATSNVSWATLSGLGVNDNGSYTIRLQVDDGSGGTSTASTPLTVTNTAPVLTVTGATTAGAATVYTLNLSATDSGSDSITSWTVNWGDGTITTHAGNPSSVTHTYSLSEVGLTFDIIVSATDEDGTHFGADVLIPSYGSSLVYQYDGSSAAPLASFAFSSDGISGHANIVQMANGDFLVSGYGSSNILRYQSNGTLVGTFVAAGSGGLSQAGGMAYGHDGHLYVASAGSNAILRYNGATGAFIDAFVPSGTAGLSSPLGVSFGPDGNLYVASRGANAVLKFNGTTGAQFTSFVSPYIGDSEDLAIGPDGNVYLTSLSNGVLRYDAATGTLIDNLVPIGTGGLTSAAGLAFGPDSRLYVSDQGGDAIRTYNASTGAFLGDYVGGGGFDGPAYLMFQADHRVTVVGTNQFPAIATNTGITLNEGSTNNVISTAMLNEGDPDDSGSGLTYTITSFVSNGMLRLNGVALGLSSTFTQADIDAGLLTYTHDGSETTIDGFGFSLADGGENGSVPATGTFDITITAVNDSPSITMPNGGQTYFEGDLSVQFDSAPLVTDPDSANFDTGTLTASIPSNASVDDRITIRNQGTGAGQIGVSGTDVLYEATIIGTWTGGTTGSIPLVVTFNSNATVAAVQALAGNIEFSNVSDTPSTAARLIRIVVTDGDGGTSNDGQNLLNVVATNDEQALAANTGLTVMENSAGSMITNSMLLTTDVDNTSGQLTYTLTSAVTYGALRLNGVALTNGNTFTQFDINSGLLTCDHDGTENFADAFSFTVDDGTGTTSSGTFNITITPVNDNNPTITSNGGGATASISIAENSTAVTTVTATDADLPSQTLTYSIAGGADATLFTIDGASGLLSFSVARDFEAPTDANGDGVYVVTVRVSDGTRTNTQTMSVSITDTNESGISAVVDSDAAADSVAENSAIGTTLGITAVATDPDGTDTITYTLTNDAGGLFAIDPNTGVVTVAGAIDREASGAYNITIRATSSDTSFTTLNVSISVTDLNESSVSTPVDSNATANSVSENATNGTLVGVTASAFDSDATNNTVTYSLVDNAGGRFTIDSITGIVSVANGLLLDRETAASHNITVRATSSDSSFSTQTFSIALSDVNEFGVGPLSDTDAAANAVGELSLAGVSTGLTIFAIDTDATSNNITYSLDDDAGGRFAINAATGVVTRTSTPLDFESVATHTIIARATSADGSSATRNFTISVLNQNEAPVAADDTLYAYQLIAFNLTAPGIVVNDTDPEYDSLQAILIIGPSNGTLVLNSDGSLTYTSNADFIGLDTFAYRVSDGSLLSNVATVTIDVQMYFAGSGGSGSGTGGSGSGTDTGSGTSTGSGTGTDTGTGTGGETGTGGATGGGGGTTGPGEITDPGGNGTGGDGNSSSTSAGPGATQTNTPPEPDPTSETVLITPAFQFVRDSGILTVLVMNNVVDAQENRTTRESSSGEIAKRTTSVLWSGTQILINPYEAFVAPQLFSVNSFVETVDNTYTTRLEFTNRLVVGSTAVVSTSLSVGYVLWILRGGSVLTTFMSTLPAWHAFDPLPILTTYQNNREEDGETLLMIATKTSPQGGTSEAKTGHTP